MHIQFSLPWKGREAQGKCLPQNRLHPSRRVGRFTPHVQAMRNFSQQGTRHSMPGKAQMHGVLLAWVGREILLGSFSGR